MVKKEVLEMIEKKEWTSLLKSLKEGSHTFAFPSTKEMNSCKAVAYAINSDGVSDNTYTFTADKAQKLLTIHVTRRNP